MVMKDTYGFSSKAKAREKEKEFIGDHYSASDRKNLSVLTLLGHEPYELQEIWDPLGVPRSNITVVESGSKAYNILKNSNWGINLAPRQEISDFLAETEDEFDVMNLDHQGYFRLARLRDIEEISYRNLLRDNGILAHWTSGKRESKPTQAFNNHAAYAYLKFLQEGGFDPSLVNEAYDTFNEELREQNSLGIIKSMEKGILVDELNPMIEKLSTKEKYYEFLKNHELFKDNGKYFLWLIQNKATIPGSETDEIFQGYFQAFKNMRNSAIGKQKTNPQDFEDYAKAFNNSIGQEFSHELIKRKVESALKEIPGIYYNDHLIASLTEMINRSTLEGYLFKGGEKYKYLNDKGTPMFLDILSFEKDNPGYVKFKIKDKKIIFNPKEISHKSINKKIEDFDFHRWTPYSYFITMPRELLTADSETKQATLPKSQEVNELQLPSIQETRELSKQDIYGLLKEGKTKQEIIEIDPSLNPRSISAYQAHVTMDNKGIKKGRPRKKKQKSSKLEKEVLSSEIPSEKTEELSKEDAVFLLKEGYSTKEILENYPGAFTDYQLRGYKAAVSRGAL